MNDKCSVHAYRFSGCRIFCCKGKATFQSELTESAIKKFKALCDELQIPYRYVELPVALKEYFTAESEERGVKRDSPLTLLRLGCPRFSLKMGYLLGNLLKTGEIF